MDDGLCRVGTPPLTLDDIKGVRCGAFDEVMVPLGPSLRTLHYRCKINLLVLWNGLSV